MTRLLLHRRTANPQPVVIEFTPDDGTSGVLSIPEPAWEEMGRPDSLTLGTDQCGAQ